mmetsp:Transcript_23305/g.32557  ORF Transcript_23305/g.32557 Transcript_23305/m.32557 type:complete len:242 (-) Transcript_23305:119-844(-)
MTNFVGQPTRVMKLFLLFLSFLLVPCHAAIVCDSDIDCLNDGKCVSAQVDIATHFSHSNEEDNICECAEGFVGPNCALHCPIKCKNSGVCTYQPDVHAQEDHALISDYFCDCKGDFKGMLCQIPYTQCTEGKKSECLNGSTCNKDGSCDCSNTKYVGEFCETKKSSSYKEPNKSGKEEVSTFGKVAIILVILGGVGILAYAIIYSRKSLKAEEKLPPITTPAMEKDASGEDSEGGKTVDII